MSVLYIAEPGGRVAGAGHTGRAVPLLGGALGLTLAGTVVFWLSHEIALALARLFVAGAGIANLYPLSLGLAARPHPVRPTAPSRGRISVSARPSFSRLSAWER